MRILSVFAARAWTSPLLSHGHCAPLLLLLREPPPKGGEWWGVSGAPPERLASRSRCWSGGRFQCPIGRSLFCIGNFAAKPPTSDYFGSKWTIGQQYWQQKGSNPVAATSPKRLPFVGNWIHYCHFDFVSSFRFGIPSVFGRGIGAFCSILSTQYTTSGIAIGAFLNSTDDC